MRDLKEAYLDNDRFCDNLKKAGGDMDKGKELLLERCQKFVDMITDATNPVIESDSIFLLYALETLAETVREHDPEAAEHTDYLKCLFGHKGRTVKGEVTITEREPK